MSSARGSLAFSPTLHSQNGVLLRMRPNLLLCWTAVVYAKYSALHVDNKTTCCFVDLWPNGDEKTVCSTPAWDSQLVVFARSESL